MDYNTKVYLRESPYADNTLKLDVELIENNSASFVFRCTDGEIVTVPVANLMMIEHMPEEAGFYEDAEDE